MPSTDISKCCDDDCPLRETCWRWLCPAGEQHSYILGRREDTECLDQLRIEPKDVYAEGTR